MNQSITHFVNLGVSPDLEILEQRRVRLLKVIASIAGLICCFFIVFDFILEAYIQSLINFIAIIIGIIPVLYFNKTQKYVLARTYFIIVSLIFINTVSLVTINQLRDTDTENILIGFSVLIIVLYGNPQKSVFFFTTALCLVVLKTVKHDLMGWTYDGDFILLIINLFVSFLCVYLFTGAFKNDLLVTLDRLEIYNRKLENQQEKILQQRNDLVANRHLLRSMINNVPLFMAMVDKLGKYLHC